MTKFRTNPDRMARWPRLPWARWPEWRPRWDRPEAERHAERVEAAWCREPFPPRVARRLWAVARRLEGQREPNRATGAWLSDAPAAEIARVQAKNAEANARLDAQWRDALAEIEAALGEIEAALDAAAAAETAPAGGPDAPAA
jgi:hypothetical protein